MIPALSSVRNFVHTLCHRSSDPIVTSGDRSDISPAAFHRRPTTFLAGAAMVTALACTAFSVPSAMAANVCYQNSNSDMQLVLDGPRAQFNNVDWGGAGQGTVGSLRLVDTNHGVQTWVDAGAKTIIQVDTANATARTLPSNPVFADGYHCGDENYTMPQSINVSVSPAVKGADSIEAFDNSNSDYEAVLSGLNGTSPTMQINNQDWGMAGQGQPEPLQFLYSDGSTNVYLHGHDSVLSVDLSKHTMTDRSIANSLQSSEYHF